MHNGTLSPRRRTLTVRSPMVEPLVQDIGAIGHELDDVRAFARQICLDRNAWSIRNGGALTHRRISRHEADNELRRALAALKGGNHG